MKTRLLIIAVIMSGNFIYARQSDCKVKLANISGTYIGECKNGLAHGKGAAQGTDFYEGQFVKGLPSGEGIYKWSNGSYYEGQWKDGLREGKGKMVLKDSVIVGYWKNDKYVGMKLIPPYIITTSQSVGRSTIKKTTGLEPVIKIRILQSGLDNKLIENFSLAYNSGSEYRSGNIYGIEQVTFPVNIKITYTTWNQLHTAQFDVIFEFTINDPGSWEVTLYN
jgi:hypothetical protein